MIRRVLISWLSNPAAQKLAETIWSEYLTESDAFGTGTVHIGMDEYFGNQKAFVDYMKALSDYVAEAPEKTIHIMGDLSKTGQDYSGLSRKNSAAGMGYGLDRSAGNV